MLFALSCSNDNDKDELLLLNTIWQTAPVTETFENGTSVHIKTLTFSTKTLGTYEDKLHVTIGGMEVERTNTDEVFTYIVDGNSIYIESDAIPVSFSGKIKGNIITLKGIDGEDVFIRK